MRSWTLTPGNESQSKWSWSSQKGAPQGEEGVVSDQQHSPLKQCWRHTGTHNLFFSLPLLLIYISLYMLYYIYRYRYIDIDTDAHFSLSFLVRDTEVPASIHGYPFNSHSESAIRVSETFLFSAFNGKLTEHGTLLYLGKIRSFACWCKCLIRIFYHHYLQPLNPPFLFVSSHALQ